MKILSITDLLSEVRMEEQLANNILHLTANETVLSPVVHSILSSPLYNRYFLEHHTMRGKKTARLGNFIYRGLDSVAVIESSALQICKQLFGADFVEFRCLSGIHAMQTTIASLTQPGECVMRVATKNGGHFLTETICKLFGRKSCTFVFDRETNQIDIEATARVIQNEHPSIIYLDAMNYLFPFPIQELREVAYDVPIVFDASHTFGLIAGGQFQNPLSEGADILQANTHKTFFGPQKGIILTNNEALMEKINYALSNALVSSQNTAGTLALFLALHEFYSYGNEYASKIISNAKYLSQALYSQGLPIVEQKRGFTSNHQFFMDTRSIGTGTVIIDKLIHANISANRMNAFEHIDAIRFGVQEITRYDYDKNDLQTISNLLVRLLLNHEDPKSIRSEVISLVQSHPIVKFFDFEAWEDNLEQTKYSNKNHSSSIKEEVLYKRIDSLPCRWINVQLDRKNIVKEIPNSLFKTISEIGKIIGDIEGQLDSAGNLSFMHNGDIFITASGGFIRRLTKEDITKIKSLKEKTFICEGLGFPSTEAFMHYKIYETTQMKVIVHFHHIVDTKQLPQDIAITGPHEYGSFELAENVAKFIYRAPIVYVRSHGFVIAGKNGDLCKLELHRLLTSKENLKLF